MQAEELLRQGRLDEALQALQKQVRDDPADAKLRVFLFQLLSVVGHWDRALTQLNLAAEMDAANLLMAQVCGAALNCEALRAEVFAGRRSPLVFGEPAEWVGWMVQAGQCVAEGQYDASRELRERAFEAAPAAAGTIDGESFEWIADADSRMGPILEAVIEARYYWVPLTAIQTIKLTEPADLRDVVWMPAEFRWANGGQAVGLIPTRYPGSESHEDPGVRLAKKTLWDERDGEVYIGLGQRMLATDGGEHALLATREIIFETAETEAGGDQGGQ